MKKIIFTALMLISVLSLSAQDQTKTDSDERLDGFVDVKKHELSLDVTAALGIPAFNPRYEYILGRYSGVGADLFIVMDSDEDANYKEIEKFSLTPYYRQYFFSKEDYGAKGFYGEGFVKFYTYDSNEGFFNGNQFVRSDETYFETALGASIGWKWVSNSGFLIDLGFGVGRNLGLANDDFSDDVIIRGGLNFGWRF